MPRRRRTPKARADRLSVEELMDLTHGGRRVFGCEEEREVAYFAHRHELDGGRWPAEAAARYDTAPEVVRSCVEGWAERHLPRAELYRLDVTAARRALAAARRRKTPGPTALELLDRYGLPWRPDPRVGASYRGR